MAEAAAGRFSVGVLWRWTWEQKSYMVLHRVWNWRTAFRHSIINLPGFCAFFSRQTDNSQRQRSIKCYCALKSNQSVSHWQWGAGNSDLGWCFGGAFSGFSGVLGALCLFRLRGSRQNKVKCFIYGLCVCVCVCVSVGVASVICVVATRQTVRRIQAAGRIVNPGSWILLSCRLRFWLSAALQMNNFNKCRAPSPLPFPFPLPEIVTTWKIFAQVKHLRYYKNNRKYTFKNRGKLKIFF